MTPQAELELDWLAQETGLTKASLLSIAMSRLMNDYTSGLWLPPRPAPKRGKIRRTNKGLKY